MFANSAIFVFGAFGVHRTDSQGQVVQSIVSLSMSLRCQFVKYMPTTLSNPLLFFVEKCENLLHFSNKK